ncbi:MAG: spore protease YyaC [Firmicutes bacterium]|nr:spore protease YyaC [Bacillota bacterium]MDD4694576.1 spore protease YyaC [Bacillota bacterium]
MWPFGGQETQQFRVHYKDEAAYEKLTNQLFKKLQTKYLSTGKQLAIVCIGTDRSTGDSLGPLTGTLLSRDFPTIPVFGTLEDPVHAANLTEKVAEINLKLKGPYIIALDACLGQSESIGYLSCKEGSLKPGTGVNKELPEIGDMNIVGIVNVGGFMEYFVLQNTRLNLVMQMAELLASSIGEAVTKLSLAVGPTTTTAAASKWIE